MQILQIFPKNYSFRFIQNLQIVRWNHFFLQNLQNVLAGFDSGRLVKVGDAKIAFLFQAKRHLTETWT